MGGGASGGPRAGAEASAGRKGGKEEAAGRGGRAAAAVSSMQEQKTGGGQAGRPGRTGGQDAAGAVRQDGGKGADKAGGGGVGSGASRQAPGPDMGGADPLADAREQFRHVSLFWTDLIHLMASKPQALTSAGPMRSYAETSKAIATEMLAAGQDAAEFSEALSKYYDQLAATWADAQRKVDAKLPRIPNDLERFEAYKRVWIDMFDNDFAELFDSKRFGDNYGRLVSKELDMARHWNNVMNVVLRSANLPNKKDIDEVYRELHGLKRRVSRLESENRRLRAAAGAAAAGGEEAGGAAGAAGAAGGAGAGGA